LADLLKRKKPLKNGKEWVGGEGGGEPRGAYRLLHVTVSIVKRR